MLLIPNLQSFRSSAGWLEQKKAEEQDRSSAGGAINRVRTPVGG